jgi:hypothetical protein
LGPNRPIPGYPVSRPIQQKNISSQVGTAPSLTSPVELPDFAEPVKESLSGMKLILGYVGYQTALLPVSDENPVEQLFVYIPFSNEDVNEDEIPFIQIMFPGDLIEKFIEKDKNPDTSHLIQFYVPVPAITVSDEKISDLKEILSVFSKISPFGYFSFNKEDGIFYRYSFLTQERELDDVLTVEIVQFINFFLVQFIPKIKNFCNGSSTFEQIIEETEIALTKPQAS